MCVLSSHLAFFAFIQSRTPKQGVAPSTLRLGLCTSIKTTSRDMSTGQSDLIHPSWSCSSQIIANCDKFAIKAGHHNLSLGSTDRTWLWSGVLVICHLQLVNCNLQSEDWVGLRFCFYISWRYQEVFITVTLPPKFQSLIPSHVRRSFTSRTSWGTHQCSNRNVELTVSKKTVTSNEQ